MATISYTTHAQLERSFTVSAGTGPESDSEPMTQEDMTFKLMRDQLESIIKRSYYRNINKYISDRPVTKNHFSTFLESTRSAEHQMSCDQYANVEKTFKSIRKHNPIECYTGRTYNHTINIESLNDLVNVLAPLGNNTSNKRTLPGHCVFVMFYTLNCISSRWIWPEYHNAHVFFPNIQWVFVDSLKFYTLNADFGITGLPTLMLFHQGKPVRKYNLVLPTAMRLIKFLWQNTNLEPVENIVSYKFNDDDFLMPLPTDEPDPYLKLAWCFLIICFLYYTAHTAAFNKFVSFMRRMWYESGAGGQHEHNE